MIGDNYRIHKVNVIDLFNSYKQKRGNLNDGVDLEFLDNRVKALKNDKYTLAIVGEVKAGKSTFINALLGRELLPADVLQTSSAIVEILKSEKPFLKIIYASGREEIINDDLLINGVFQFHNKLFEICSISEKYRDIPCTVLNEKIIKGQKINVNDKFIDDLGNKVQTDLSSKIELIEEYINTHSKDNIAVEIHVGYPLKWNFDELRIVDSPGVNAVGGVQNIAFDYLGEANAIIFVNPIKPIESKLFRDFINLVIPNRNKETLFLVLTHAGLYTDNDVEKLHLEARRLYAKEIIPERILVVDSLLKLISNDLENGLSLEEIKKISEQKKKMLPFFKDIAEESNKNIKEVLINYSRFEKMFETIDKFSLQAPNLQLQEILEKIKDGYRDQEAQRGEKIDLLEAKKRNPQEFEELIADHQKALSHYEYLIHTTKEELEQSYTGRHSEWNELIENLKSKYPELITQSDNPEVARKNFIDGVNDIKQVIIEFSKSITRDLSNKLEERGKAFKKDHKITIPSVDLQSIQERANQNAYRNEPVYESVTKTRKERRWYTLWIWEHEVKYTQNVKVGENKVFDENLYFKALKTDLNVEFYKIINSLPEKSKEVLKLYLDTFNEEIIAVIEERKKALEEDRNKKQTNEQLIIEIDDLKVKKKEIPPELKRVEEILEDLK